MNEIAKKVDNLSKQYRISKLGAWCMELWTKAIKLEGKTPDVSLVLLVL